MNWRTIKNFGKVKYFNISYAILIIVPILASTFHMLNNKFCFCLTIPETLKSLYYASILYAVAIAVYQYKCPVIIKEYVNLQDYLDKNLEYFMNKAPEMKIHIVLAHLDINTRAQTRNEIIELNSKLATVTEETEKSKYKFELEEKLNLVYSSSIQAHLEKKYNSANSENLFALWISALFYILGSLIILILLIIKTILVMNS